ncbi:uncharacterized protein LOC127899891 [Citrus sinensis]|uniref:uncharacterized protein LOC127899891 n=1 Tax=Citrus sinensis TaxID=2711 RepID=UPI002278EBDC|nr:uncharacterized protein LOC127899891 [Citrus sinensis]
MDILVTLAVDRSIKKAKFREQGEDEDNPSPPSFPDIVMEIVHECLAQSWEHSVVVKILGRNLGYRMLLARLKSIWSATKGFTVVDLAQDYYLVHFSNKRDVEYALTEGPWTVMGHYLIVQQWSPSFDVTTNKIEKIVAWIRLAEMNIHLYHKNIIRCLGEIVRPVVKIDYKTVEVQRGKFTRIAVEIDLHKPLISQFNFDGRIQRVEYEYLPTICFGCGKIGHYKDACPDNDEVVPRNENTGDCSDRVGWAE